MAFGYPTATSRRHFPDGRCSRIENCRNGTLPSFQNVLFFKVIIKGSCACYNINSEVFVSRLAALTCV